MTKIYLETDRLTLRDWKEADIGPFYKMNSCPVAMEYFPKPLSELESEAMYLKAERLLLENGYGFYAVELKETGEFIGFIGVHEPDFEAPFMPCMEIGWRIDKKFWGNGYTPEAAKEILRFCFEELKKNEIVSMTTIKNKKSRRVMEKIGMIHNPEEDFEHPKCPVGDPTRPHVLYRIKRK